MRIAQDGNYNDIYYVKMLEAELVYNLIEDDYVLVKGTVDGIVTYNTVLNSKASLPGVQAEIIELIQ